MYLATYCGVRLTLPDTPFKLKVGRIYGDGSCRLKPTASMVISSINK